MGTIDSLGDRLREERERLKLNQTEFGLAAGVGRKAQFNYEANERVPDAAYLLAIRELGADVMHILFGRREFPPPVVLSADEAVLLRLWREATAARRVKTFAVLAGSSATDENRTVFNGPVGQRNENVSGGNFSVNMGEGMKVKVTTTPKRGPKKP